MCAMWWHIYDGLGKEGFLFGDVPTASVSGSIAEAHLFTEATTNVIVLVSGVRVGMSRCGVAG